MSRCLFNKAIRGPSGGGVRRRPRRAGLGGVGISAGGHRADGGELRRRRRGGQRAGGGGRGRGAGGGRRRPARRATGPVRRGGAGGGGGGRDPPGARAQPLTPAIGPHKVRRSSRNLAVEDPLTADEV